VKPNAFADLAKGEPFTPQLERQQRSRLAPRCDLSIIHRRASTSSALPISIGAHVGSPSRGPAGRFSIPTKRRVSLPTEVWCRASDSNRAPLASRLRVFASPADQFRPQHHAIPHVLSEHLRKA